MTDRTAAEVLEDHLRLRSESKLEEDLERNYSPDVLVFSSEGRFYGHDGIRETASILDDFVDPGEYEYLEKHADGDIAFLTWKASRDGYDIHGGDSFVIRDGRIVVQTIHFVRTRDLDD